jgi:hypothetical protein
MIDIYYLSRGTSANKLNYEETSRMGDDGENGGSEKTFTGSTPSITDPSKISQELELDS